MAFSRLVSLPPNYEIPSLITLAASSSFFQTMMYVFFIRILIVSMYTPYFISVISYSYAYSFILSYGDVSVYLLS